MGEPRQENLFNFFMNEDRHLGERFGLFGGRNHMMQMNPRSVAEVEKLQLNLDKLFFKTYNNDEIYSIKPDRAYIDDIEKGFGS